jgi:hypothetical protein
MISSNSNYTRQGKVFRVVIAGKIKLSFNQWEFSFIPHLNFSIFLSFEVGVLLPLKSGINMPKIDSLVMNYSSHLPVGKWGLLGPLAYGEENSCVDW